MAFGSSPIRRIKIMDFDGRDLARAKREAGRIAGSLWPPGSLAFLEALKEAEDRTGPVARFASFTGCRFKRRRASNIKRRGKSLPFLYLVAPSRGPPSTGTSSLGSVAGFALGRNRPR